MSAEGGDVSTIESDVEFFGPEGLNVGEKQLFENIADIHKTPLLADFWIIEDPQEARKIIQEAGLK